ncbi:MAG: hypothetical protein ACFFCI_22680 [Promethearchaeota archaeon]
MSKEEISKCFVVMPFGKKPFNDGTEKTYDFDKVYKIVIKRAIKEAGMEPIRADEKEGSDLIHREMFRELRDRSVVLADLSLYNPNVFYELGIRHVFSSKGTILMCCKTSSNLPFDINLSRVNFYDYDGKNFDWEEVERVVPLLRQALMKAKSGVPDSPVHAFLDPIFPEISKIEIKKEEIQPLDTFQKIIAKYWIEKEKNLSELLEKPKFVKSTFGIRAIGYMSLETECDQDLAIKIAENLHDLEQHDISIRIYEKLEKNGIQLSVKDLINYGSAKSEIVQDLESANEGLKIQQRALKIVKPQIETENTSLKTLEDAAGCYHSIAGMLHWKWILVKDDKDLELAIDYYKKALNYGNDALKIGNKFSIGYLANIHLKLLTLLRIKDENIDRTDSEDHRNDILKLEPTDQQKDENISYLNWYKAITYADLGDNESLQDAVFTAFEFDGIVMNKPVTTSVGRRQYTRIRRFIEEFFNYLRNPSLMGYILQKLQTPHNIR